MVIHILLLSVSTNVGTIDISLEDIQHYTSHAKIERMNQRNYTCIYPFMLSLLNNVMIHDTFENNN